MPIFSPTGVRGLFKRHSRECGNRRHPERCGCPWRGKHKKREVGLAKWANQVVDPRSQEAGLAVFRRMQAAIDKHEFDPTGERAPLGDADKTLRGFIDEFKSRYEKTYGSIGKSFSTELGVIAAGRLGRMTLEELAGNSKAIEDWLNDTAKKREWSNKTWVGYHGHLHNLCERATLWTVDGVPRMRINPVKGIPCRVCEQPDHFRKRHLEEDVEDRLFEACAQLNRPLGLPTKAKITLEIAEEIRGRLAKGETGRALAARFKISPAVVSSIKHGDIWNPEQQGRIGTKGTEMERRLIGAFDGGLRAGEMLQLTIAHVNWRLVRVTKPDGTEISGYEIGLPATITKGGKRTGEMEYILAATPRFKALLESRRFALKGNPPTRQYLFGTEAGKRQKGFRRMWRALFTAAGLDWGRHKGLVWHTTRHEFISRVVERDGEAIGQEAARHRDPRTTKLYSHNRRSRLLSAMAGLSRA